MPGKQPGDMHNFVKGRNSPINDPLPAAPREIPSLDDLKVQPPKASATTHSRQQQSKGRTANPTAQVKSNAGPGVAPPQRQRVSDGQKAFYDTDADSIDNTITSNSTVERSRAPVTRTQQQQIAAPHQQGGRQRSSSATGSGSETSEYEDEGQEGSGDDLPDNPRTDDSNRGPQITGDLNAKQRAKMTTLEANSKNVPSGYNLPHMKGDTYPSTTSGNPSITDDEIRTNGGAELLPQRGHGAANGALPTRGPSHQGFGARDGPVHAQAPTRSQVNLTKQTLATSGLLARAPDARVPVPLEQDISTNFTYVKPGKQQKTTLPPAQPHQPSALEALQQRKITTPHNTAQRASAPTANGASDHQPQHQHKAVKVRETAQSHETSHDSKPHKQSRPSNHAQLESVETVREDEEFSDYESSTTNQVVNGAYAGEQRPQPRLQLDYDTPDLFEMEYADLKSQSFDVDPNAVDFKLPADQQSDTLEQKLTTVGALQAQDQEKFFSSLSIDEWEQAGDWFLGRFSEVVGKLKDARQEKRKAAKSFELEVESRHKAVGRKRKHIEESLSEMKESGGKVLEGTPKRVKKTK